MRYFIIFSIFLTEILAENETEFVPIGKDTESTTTPSFDGKKSVVVPPKVYKEDGKSPDVKPSILPVPVPNLSGLMNRIQTTLVTRMEVVPPSRPEFYPPDSVVIARAEGPIYQRPSGFERQYPPPPYPPMMMYPPSPDSLMGRVESMTGNILDNVMEFVMGRRRR
ncbi:hypothetical protein GCK72_016753 [Caenorhabditis remanei]|uniref:Uncharacterized protein n=1 Tax=Caenorhabditis remanei TaxID=31234 RepID=A0A6A5G5R4_CAERE|nr:hypothetical protein GCK72_016753 [Caenorhabditis remanei]KAF1750206.1 hypothetical protein GCK72_016753 [Caenorhabditis remanei]